MAERQKSNKEKAKGVGAGATYDTQNQPEADQEPRQQSMQKGEGWEKARDYPDDDDQRRGVKIQEPRGEDDH